MEDYLNTQDVIQDQIDDLIFELIKVRKKNKITQIKLSQMTGIPQTTISRIESLNTIPTLPILMKIINALNFSLVLNKNM
ncbi:helix-turn-helix domain-containing protein [Bariatricus sp. SGI.154]|uniref:helix-turn-helix domain-containing protein n=1 Tax=Bariatricus sp. SGI.154 TaxID=3420549 RepID=UPI003D024BC2